MQRRLQTSGIATGRAAAAVSATPVPSDSGSKNRKEPSVVVRASMIADASTRNRDAEASIAASISISAFLTRCYRAKKKMIRVVHRIFKYLSMLTDVYATVEIIPVRRMRGSIRFKRICSVVGNNGNSKTIISFNTFYSFYTRTHTRDVTLLHNATLCNAIYYDATSSFSPLFRKFQRIYIEQM